MKILPLKKSDQSPRRVLHEAINYCSLFEHIIVIGFHREKEKPVILATKCGAKELCVAAVEMNRIAQEELKKK